MTPYDVVKLLLTFFGAAATPVAALPDNLIPIWGKVAAVAVGSACVATLAQLDKLGHRHPSASRNDPDRSPLVVNDVPVSAVNRAHDPPDAIYAAGYAAGLSRATDPPPELPDRGYRPPPTPAAAPVMPTPRGVPLTEPVVQTPAPKAPGPRAGQYPGLTG